ncbi:hypothetical protein HF521_018073 [Silurus meridionalis]|uniref:Ig-like domain-containing protein n=1 Tax=Silurus meridionalis TaxID=175797 RepID=A0A8T0BU86_SILME|nr:hypothetical protein HF521_018073 [Silurus meridionalis]
MEIRWFKGADCICVYQNGQMREGKDYEGRVSLFTHELKEGNLSLMLRNVQELDNGEYKCKVTHGKDKNGQLREGEGYEGRVSLFTHELEEGNVSLMLRSIQESDDGEYKCEVIHGKDKVENDKNWLSVSGFKLVSSSSGYSHYFNGNDATFPCHLSPKKSAVAMEIRWFKGADCICVYQNGQVREGIDYEGRVSLFTHELKEGNLSLMLRNVQESDNGEYKCEITHGKDKVESDQISLCVRALLKGLPVRQSLSVRQSLPSRIYSPSEESIYNESTWNESRTRSLSDPCDLQPRKPERRRSHPIVYPIM